HQIRILGYSFPATDPYIRYLLAAALRNNGVLKQVDMICLDPDGDVKARFERTITFRRRRFISDYTQQYLSTMSGNLPRKGDVNIYEGMLELGHDNFMARAVIEV